MSPVAVIIVTWNSAHLIERVLHALSLQTLKPARVLLIDNGSKDVDALASVASRFEACVLLRLSENLGFASANNVGIDACKTHEFIALLNPDAFPEPDWLAELLAAARQYPQAAAFGSRLIDHADPDRLDGAGDFMSIAGKPGRRGHRESAAGRFLRGEEVFAPCAAAALYRSQALIAVGGFDERFFCYVEDVDLAFRLLLQGHGSRYVAESVVVHMGSALTGRRSDFSIYHGQRNLVFNYVKNMPSWLFWVFLIPHLMMNFAYLVGVSLSGKGRVIWRAKCDAIRMLPEFWASRRKIQAQRKVGVWRVLRLLRVSLW